MKAFKFLSAGARARFSRHAWSMPRGATPGAWVEAARPLKLCAQGIHACRTADLPYWIDDELWRIELDGELLNANTMIVAERGRLIERVSRWEADLRTELAQFCRARAHAVAAQALAEGRPEAALAQRFADDVATLAGLGQLAAAVYVSAVAARCISDQSAEEAYLAERAVQSGWLAERVA